MEKINFKLVIIKVCLFFVIIFSVTVLLQDFLILPSLHMQYYVDIIPARNATEEIIETPSRKIHLWKYAATTKSNSQKIAIHFVGNGEIVPNNTIQIQFLNNLGYDVYACNYRGIGPDTWYMSESGIKKDIIAIADYVSEKENIKKEDILISGFSFGTGSATYAAYKLHSKTLLVLAPYTSLRNVAASKPIFKYPSYLLRTNFSQEELFPKFENTCVVMGHGKKDLIIPYTNSVELKKLYKGKSKVFLNLSDTAEHMNILNAVADKLTNDLNECLKRD